MCRDRRSTTRAPQQFDTNGTFLLHEDRFFIVNRRTFTLWAPVPEPLTKTREYETRIIISGSTLAKAKQPYRTRRLGEIAVKGKQKQTEIFARLDQGYAGS
jgi:hypothetical protein